MSLSIKTAEADRLARELGRLTGETITAAITAALREHLARQQAVRAREADLPARIRDFSRRVRRDYDVDPVSRAEWGWASGDNAPRQRQISRPSPRAGSL